MSISHNVGLMDEETIGREECDGLSDNGSWIVVDAAETDVSTDTEVSPARERSPPQPTFCEYQRQCRGTVPRQDLLDFVRMGVSNVTGIGSAEADEVINDVLAAVSNLDIAAKGFSWKSKPFTLHGITICMQMKQLVGEAEEEMWAVAIDAGHASSQQRRPGHVVVAKRGWFPCHVYEEGCSQKRIGHIVDGTIVNILEDDSNCEFVKVEEISQSGIAGWVKRTHLTVDLNVIISAVR
jgi:hypothetical protein